MKQTAQTWISKQQIDVNATHSLKLAGNSQTASFKISQNQWNKSKLNKQNKWDSIEHYANSNSFI